MNDLDKVSEALQTGLLKLFTSVGLVAGSLLIMFFYHVPLTVVFLIFTGLSMVLTNFFTGKTLKTAARRQRALSRLTSCVEESMSGRMIIKAFNREEQSRQESARRRSSWQRKPEKPIFLPRPSTRPFGS